MQEKSQPTTFGAIRVTNETLTSDGPILNSSEEFQRLADRLPPPPTALRNPKATIFVKIDVSNGDFVIADGEIEEDCDTSAFRLTPDEARQLAGVLTEFADAPDN
jgi:hypothetical protein